MSQSLAEKAFNGLTVPQNPAPVEAQPAAAPTHTGASMQVRASLEQLSQHLKDQNQPKAG